MDIWDMVNAQVDELKSAKSADDVMRILSRERNGQWHAGSGEGFFAGSGGDRSVLGALYAAGWQMAWSESPIYYVLRAPNGDLITYCEGDVDRGAPHGVPLV
jgi:hypothetical protein